MPDFLEKQVVLQTMAHSICDMATASKATDAQVYVSYSDGHEINVRQKKLTSLEKKSGYSIGIILYQGQKTVSY